MCTVDVQSVVILKTDHFVLITITLQGQFSTCTTFLVVDGGMPLAVYFYVTSPVLCLNLSLTHR